MTKRNTVAILGIPVDNLNTQEVITKALELMEQFKTDQKPKYISTVNVDFLVNTHSWNSNSIRYPELLNALRQSELVTADGMPLIWFSKWVNTPLKERVSGADLVPQLLKALEKEHKSVFLLGGQEEIAKKAAHHLKNLYPNLSIKGIASPHIPTEGQSLENAEHIDQQIVSDINTANPDLLLISLGNPKQEIWFQRIRRKIHIPLSIGIGGTFQFMTKTIPRAPQWMQRWGLEWLFRLIQEPKRLWKRYLWDACKFLYIVLPLTLFHHYKKIITKTLSRPSSQNEIQENFQFSSNFRTITSISLPEQCTTDRWDSLNNAFEQAINSNILVVNFSQVRFIDPKILGLLLTEWKHSNNQRKEIYGLKISPSLQKLLLTHRCWDFFSPHHCQGLQDLFARLKYTFPDDSILCEAFEQKDNHTIIHLFGCLDAAHDYEEYYSRLTSIIKQTHCVLDLSYCPFIDSSGLGFLLKLRKYCLNNGRKLKLCGVHNDVMQIFHVVNLEKVFEFFPATAMKSL